MGRRVRGIRWGDSGRALTRSPFLLCCKSCSISQRSAAMSLILTCCTSSLVSSLNSLDIMAVCVKDESALSGRLLFRVGSKSHADAQHHMRSITRVSVQ